MQKFSAAAKVSVIIFGKSWVDNIHLYQSQMRLFTVLIPTERKPFAVQFVKLFS